MFGFLKRLFGGGNAVPASTQPTPTPKPSAPNKQRKVSMSNELKAHGKMKVSTFKDAFRESFGVNVRVYHGKKFADDSATLASIRSGDAKGQGIHIHGRTKVGNVEKKFLEELGIRIQIENADGDLADNDLGLTELQRRL